MNDTNDLQEGAGENVSLKPKGDFEARPYRRQLLHLSREALRPVIRILIRIEGERK